MNVVSFARRKSLNAKAALVYLAKVAESHPDGIVETDSITHLGTLLGWTQPRTSKAVKAWKAAGQITVDRAANGKLVIRVMPIRAGMERDGMPSQGTAMPKTKRVARRPVGHAANHAVEHAADHVEPAHSDHAKSGNTNDKSTGKPLTVDPAGAHEMPQNEPASGMPSGMTAGMPGGMPQTMPSGMPQTMPFARENDHPNQVTQHAEQFDWRRAGSGRGGEGDVLNDRHAPFAVVAAYLTALVLALIAAWFSVRGMVVLFPGDPTSALVLGVGLETAKIATVGYVAAFWGRLAWIFRISLLVLAFGCEVLNASGVFGQLVIAHLHKGAVAEANFERTDAEASGRIDVAQGRVADLDRRIATIDGMVDGAAQKGRSKQAANLLREQQRERAQLVSARDQARQELASLRTSRSSGSAQHKVDEAESAPVVWAARTIGIERDPEVIIRSIIALIVICLDPLAIMLMAAVSSGSGRRRWEEA